MKKRENDSLTYYQSDLFDSKIIKHGFFREKEGLVPPLLAPLIAVIA